jgi:DME family drug/metabolite transporter
VARHSRGAGLSARDGLLAMKARASIRPALPQSRDITEMRAPRANLGIVLVLLAGVLWSLQGYFVRLIDDADAPQIIFWRNYGQFVTLILMLTILQRGRLLTAFRRAGGLAVVGGMCQAMSTVVIIYAFLLTSIANVMFILGIAPFFAALMAWTLMGERVGRVTWAAMTVALLGVGVMVFQGLEPGHLLGNLYAFIAALGFAGLTVVLRWGRRVEMLPTLCYGGALGMLAGLVLTGGAVAISLHDAAVAFIMGAFILAIGMLAFVRGARHVPAGILAFLTMTEIVLSPVWPWIGMNEIPKPLTILGGAIILAAIAGQALHASFRRAR